MRFSKRPHLVPWESDSPMYKSSSRTFSWLYSMAGQRATWMHVLSDTSTSVRPHCPPKDNASSHVQSWPRLPYLYYFIHSNVTQRYRERSPRLSKQEALLLFSQPAPRRANHPSALEARQTQPTDPSYRYPNVCSPLLQRGRRSCVLLQLHNSAVPK